MFDDERVLVTGGASFIGSHLVEDLVERGADVRVADDFSSGTRENLSAVAEEIEVVAGGLKRRSIADEATEGIDRLFHLAAEHGGRGYIANYPANCATNMALDDVVFESTVKTGREDHVRLKRLCLPNGHLRGASATLRGYGKFR